MQFQLEFFNKELQPSTEQAARGERKIFFVDAAHFVLGPFLGLVWCFSRPFPERVSRRGARWKVALLFWGALFQATVFGDGAGGRADEAQRLPMDFLIKGAPWLALLDDEKQPVLTPKELEDVVCMIVVSKPGTLDAIVVREVREYQEEVFSPTPSTLSGHSIQRIRSSKPAGAFTKKGIVVEPKRLTGSLRLAWNLVRDAKLGSQEHRLALGENEEWVILAAGIPDGGDVSTRLHGAEVINPKKAAVILRVWADFLAAWGQGEK